MPDAIRTSFDTEENEEDDAARVAVQLHTYNDKVYDVVMDLEQFIAMSLDALKTLNSGITFSWFDEKYDGMHWFEIHSKDIQAIAAYSLEETTDEEA